MEGLGDPLEAELCPHCTVGVSSRLPDQRRDGTHENPTAGLGRIKLPRYLHGSEEKAQTLIGLISRLRARASPLLISMSSQESW